MPPVNRNSDRGSASIEFVMIGMLLIVPVIYLIIVLTQLQAGAFAAEGAARQAAREWVQERTLAAADSAAERVVALAAADFQFDPATVRWHRECGGTCLGPETRVTITVEVLVPLPLVPPVLRLEQRSSIRMSGHATQTVSKFGGAP